MSARRDLAAIALTLALTVSCAEPPIAANQQNIYAFPSDASLLVPDEPGPTADADATSRRDAVVRLSIDPAGPSHCGGILLGPRVVATAAHCPAVGPGRTYLDSVMFHRDWLTSAPDQRAHVIGCFVADGALDDVAAPIPCGHPQLIPGGTHLTSLDWAILVLDRRVDRSAQGTTIVATPASRASAEPAMGAGITWASAEHLFQPSGDLAIDPTIGRVRAALAFGDIGPDARLPGFGNFTHFIDTPTTEFLTVSGGDSGSPFYLNRPDLGEPVTLVALTTRQFGPVLPGVDAGTGVGMGVDAAYPDGGPIVLMNPNIEGNRPVWDDDVRRFLARFLDCATPRDCFVDVGRGRRVFVGPADGAATGSPHAGDLDGDGLDDTNGHDICPGVYDPDQLDQDHDGVGDACDDCAGQADTLQDNCNEDAERQVQASDGTRPVVLCSDDAGCTATQFCARGSDWAGPSDRRPCAGGADCRCRTAIRGDLCDPTACGLTDMRTTPVGDPTTLPTLRTTRVVVDGRQSTSSAPSVQGSTGFRFCPCAGALGNTVDDRQFCANAADNPVACGINATGSYSTLAMDPENQAWRWITTSHDTPTGAPGPDLVQRGSYGVQYEPTPPGMPDVLAVDASFTHCLQNTDATYCAQSDVTRWLADSTLSGSFPRTAAEAAMLRGVLWTHTTSLGVATRIATTEICDNGMDDNGDGAVDCLDPRCSNTVACLTSPLPLVPELSSHYWSGMVPDARTIIIPGTAPPAWISVIGPIVGDAACPYCAGFFPEIGVGWAGLRTIPPFTQVDYNAVGLAIGQYRVPVAAFGLPLFDPAIFAGAGRRWVSAAEPTQWLEPTGARFVSLDATNVVQSIVLAGQGALFRIDAQCPKGQCNQGPFIALASPLVAAPVARSGSQFVLSARRRTLFVIGGEGAHGPVSSIDAFSTDSLSWTALPTSSIALGRVLAATYSAEDDMLYVVDEHDVGHRRFARILGIDPITADAHVVAEWRRLTPNDRFQITAGAAHRLYVAASLGQVAHVVVALDLDGTPRGIAAGLGGLTTSPIHASAIGLTLVVTGVRGPHPIGYEWQQLVPGARMMERCF